PSASSNKPNGPRGSTPSKTTSAGCWINCQNSGCGFQPQIASRESGRRRCGLSFNNHLRSRVPEPFNLLAPAARDLGGSRVGQLVAVRLIVFLLRRVGFNLRASLLEIAEAEVLVDGLNLADRVADKLFIADFTEVFRRNEVFLREIRIIHPR